MTRSILYPLLPLLLLPALSMAGETLRLIPGEKRLLPIPSPDAVIETSCSAESVGLFRSVDGRNVEVEARKVGACELTIAGYAYAFQVYDPSSGGARTCDEARERVAGTGLTVRCRNGYVEIAGFPLDSLVRYELENWAASRHGVRLDLVDPPEEEVEVTFSFLEMRRQDGLDIGVDWPSVTPDLLGEGVRLMDGGGTSARRIFGPFTDNVSAEAIYSNFEVLEIRTGRTVLGQPMEIIDGGSIYREASGVEVAQLQEIPFGLRGLVEVQRNGLGYALDIDLEISEEVPGSTRREIRLTGRGVKTRVNIDNEQTIVISTGESNRSWEQKSGLPLLSRIPVLGLLFGKLQRGQSPVMGAVMVTVNAPGEHPDWLARLADLEQRLGPKWK